MRWHRWFAPRFSLRNGIVRSSAAGTLLPDNGAIVVGLLLVTIGLVVVFLATTWEIAAAYVAFVTVVVLIPGIIASLVFRSLWRGFGFSMRWTVGFVGNWFSF